jgi:hypothetical protein
MKKLFALRNTETGKLLDGEFFSSKFRAKEMRNELNGSSTEVSDMKWVVTYGPDHRKYRLS